jgi:hypothetical protein
MKVSELIEVLKQMPQDLEVYCMSENSDYDYTPMQPHTVRVIKDSESIDEDSNGDPEYIDICVIGDWFA